MTAISISATLCLSALVWAASPQSPTRSLAPSSSPVPALQATPKPTRRPRLEATPKPTQAPLLEGIVTGPDNKPVPNALVIARSSTDNPLQPGVSARSDPKGRFQLRLKSSAIHTVWVEARGLAARDFPNVQPGAYLKITLEKGGTIDGTVREGSSGAPISGARIEARIAGGIPLPMVPDEPDAGSVTATTDRAGRYRLEGLARGLYDVSAVGRGFARARQGSAKVGSKVDLFLYAGASLSGIVTGPEGKPVAGALVSAEEGVYAGFRATAGVKTDAQCRFELLGLAPGSYTVVAQQVGLAPGITTDVVVLEQEDSTTSVALASGAAVTGRLLGPSRRPVAGPVSVEELDGRPPPLVLADRLRAEAGQAGRFRIDAVPPGSHTLVVAAPGFAPVRLELDVPVNAPGVNLGDVLLETGITIRGHIRDTTGQAITDATLWASPPDGRGMGRSAEAKSQADGSYVLAGLSPTPYVVGVRASGFGSAHRRVDAGDDGADFVLEQSGTLTGTVVDDLGRPIDSFQVAVQAAESREAWPHSEPITSGDGRFSVENLEKGTYVVTASAPDRTSATLSGVKVRVGATTDVGRIRLGEGGVLRGLVVSSDGTPIPGATVLAQPAGNRIRVPPEDQRDLTNAGGAFEMRGVPAGPLELRATHPTFVTTRVRGIEVDPVKGVAEARIVMTRGGRIEGWVRQRDGTAASGIFARAMIDLPDDSWSAELDRVPVAPDGHFDIDRVPQGRVGVALLRRTASGIFENLQTKQVEVHESEVAEVEFTLRDILVTGVVTRSGSPAANFRVIFSGAAGLLNRDVGNTSSGPQRLTALTREDGSYELLLDGPGKTSARVESLDGSTRYAVPDIEIPDADTYVLDIEFARVPLSGTVVDAESNEPIAQARVWAYPASNFGNGMSARALTGSDGRFQIEVEKGKCRLNIWAEGYPSQASIIDVGPSGASDLRLALSRGSSLRGRLLDPQGRASGGLDVSAVSGNPARGGSMDGAITLPDGSFHFPALLARPYNLFAGSAAVGFALRANATPGDEEILLQLKPGGRVHVEVRGPDGIPVDGAYADIAAVDGAPVVGFDGRNTDAQGVAEMTVPMGLVQLTAQKGLQRGEVAVDVAAGDMVSAEIRLSAPPP